MRVPLKRTTKPHSKDNFMFPVVSIENYSELSHKPIFVPGLDPDIRLTEKGSFCSPAPSFPLCPHINFEEPILRALG